MEVLRQPNAVRLVVKIDTQLSQLIRCFLSLLRILRYYMMASITFFYAPTDSSHLSSKLTGEI